MVVTMWPAALVVVVVALAVQAVVATGHQDKALLADQILVAPTVVAVAQEVLVAREESMDLPQIDTEAEDLD